MAVDGRLEISNVDPCFAEDASSQTVLLQQRKQQMLRFKLLMLGALRQLLGGDDGGPGLFGELFRRGLHLGCGFNWLHRMGLPPSLVGANRSHWLGLHANGRLTGSSF